MFYIYILRSLKNADLYVGFSEKLRNRFKSHNEGQVSSTKFYRPWELIYYEGYKHKKDAIIREKQLKEHSAKDDLKKQLKYSLAKG